jgi:ankyrin repeat protein
MSSSLVDARFYFLRAAMFNGWQVAQALIEEDSTIIEARSGTGETALHYLAVENHLEGVAYLLERGADINTRDDFQGTPLIAAASLGHLGLCRFLLGNGADIYAADDIGRTAISAASTADRNRDALLELLLAHKGDADINSFFDDLDAEDMLTRRGSQASEFWRSLGLRSRYNYSSLDEDERD